VETSEGPYAADRVAMVDYLAREVHDERVLRAMAAVPRERFVAPELRGRAYDNTPLPIGFGQTISQPLVIAIMLEALELQGDERVLEVGTGSGYQAALLSHLAREVVTVERIAELASAAALTLREEGCANVAVEIAGHVLGWPPGAPYDAIVVAAASPEVPPALIDQLADGGRLVVPVGTREEQTLVVAVKAGNEVKVTNRGPCRFVPLIGAGAFEARESSN
jgi:protein-L-isoaspartate(D-aspartate) O-methyltransferase